MVKSYKYLVNKRFSYLSAEQGFIFAYSILEFLLTLVRAVLELERGQTGLLVATSNLVKNFVYKFWQKGRNRQLDKKLWLDNIFVVK